MATVVLDHIVPKISQDVYVQESPIEASGVRNIVARPKQLVGDALCRHIEDIDHHTCEPGDEDTFFVADLGEVYRQHLRWKLTLPRIKPFYAVKCNPDAKILQLLAGLDTGFDCASKAEVEEVLKIGVDPERIIYAQPCKTNSYVRFVKSVGVKKMTFDNADELHKIARLFPDARLFLRIMTDDESSQCRLSMKFGAAMESTGGLLALARDLRLNVVGVSFHVGSGASDPSAFEKAVRDSYAVFQQARGYGFELQTLDVGGGFSGDTFEAMAAVLCAALDEYFPPHSNVDIIAEPGRYYVASAFTMACHVIARRTVEDAGPAETGYMIYVNDGIYGNFSCIMYDHQNPVPRVLRSGGKVWYDTPSAGACAPGKGLRYSIWGPTCDGIDRITESIRFGQVLEVGDWLYFESMGAYTKCSATRFNGFSNEHDVIYVCSEPGAEALLGLGVATNGELADQTDEVMEDDETLLHWWHEI